MSNTFPATVPARAPANEPVADWLEVTGLALEIIRSNMESDFERVCRLAELARPPSQPRPPQARPTPQSTIEAIMYCVRVRGLGALREPGNVERLSRSDEAAKAQINQRIAKLKEIAR
jgi:hypothetical protein